MGLIQYPLTVDGGLAVTSGDGAVAFDLACAADPCATRWRSASTRSGMTATSGGLVFVGEDPHRIVAFPSDCSDPCSPAWSWQGTEDLSAPAISDAAIYVVDAGGRVYAFSPDADASPPTSPAAKRSAAIFYGVLAVGIAGTVLVRRRRRRLV
jgi:outer membrane protein assembly factor BamB